MENPNPTFSIIVPVYKVEPYMRQCLDSILGQSNPDFELILVDDGSPDRCGAICDEYAACDGRIRVIHKANGGHAAARNDGMKIARGSYILFVDADDWLEKEALELLAPLAAEGPDAVVFSFCYRYDTTPPHVCEAGSLQSLPARCDNAAFLRHVATHRAFELGLLCNKLYKRALFEKHGIRLIENTIHDDGPFFLETFYRARKIALLPRTLYNYRQRADSTTATHSIRNFESLMEGIAHTEALLENRSYDKYIRLILLNYAVFAVTQRYRTTEDTQEVLRRSRTREYRQMLRKLMRQSHFAWKSYVLGCLILLSPRLTKKLLKTL